MSKNSKKVVKKPNVDYLFNENLSPDSLGKIGKMNVGSTTTTRIKRSGILKYWSFTWDIINNEDDGKRDYESKKDSLVRIFYTICKNFSFQLERGLKTNYIHIQGSLELNKPMRYTEFKLPKDIYWEGSRSICANFYCEKEETKIMDTITFGNEQERPLKLITDLRPWQQTVNDLIKLEPDDRTINWVYNQYGDAGKTKITKYLFVNSKIICSTGGKISDIANIIYNEKNNGFKLNNIWTMIFNFNCSNEGYISYKSIEAVKDGLITNTKYESGTLIFNCPHVWIFANELPDYSKLSLDRWKIWTIDNHELIDYVDQKLIDLKNLRNNSLKQSPKSKKSSSLHKNCQYMFDYDIEEE